MVRSPILAVPVKAILTVVESVKVKDPEVKPVVPVPIVKSLVATPDLKSLPVTTIDAPFAALAIVLVVEIVGAEATVTGVPPVYAIVEENAPQLCKPSALIFAANSRL